MKRFVVLMLAFCLLLCAGCHNAPSDTPEDTFSEDATGTSETVPPQKQQDPTATQAPTQQQADPTETQAPTQQDEPVSKPEPTQPETSAPTQEPTQPATTPPTEPVTAPEETEGFVPEDDELSGMPL